MKTSSFSFKIWLKVEVFLQKKLKLNWIAKSGHLSIIMMICVFINMITIIVPYTNISETTASKFDTLDQVLTYIFIVEFVIKILGLGPLLYFRDNWNKLDFSMILISLAIDVTFSFLWAFWALKVAKTLKVARLARS